MLIKHCLFLLMVTGSVTAFANHFIGSPNAFTVRGRVVDQNGNGLGGATVAEKGQANNTLTTADGSFGITIQGQSAVLVVSYVGFQGKEVSVNGATSNLLVQLTANISSLDSVIVVGYGTQRRSLSTVSVSSVKGEQIAAVPAANFTNTLAGRTTGILTRSNGGRPGADNAQIFIRGIATTGNASPLIVVDNVIRNNINEIDNNNIASVTVLKDAAAVAPYGLGGANGVILITTKRGTSGAPQLSVSGYYGDQQPVYLPKMLNAIDYMKLKNEAYKNENPTGTNFPYALAYVDNYIANNQQNPDLYPISDALNDVVRKHSPMAQGNIQVRGGSQNVKYYAGISYFTQKGMFDKSNYNRYNYNVNLDLNVTATTLVSLSLNGAIQKTSDVDGGTGQLFRGVYKFLPVAPLYYSNGLWGESSGNAPIGVIKSDGYWNENKNNILSTLSIEQKLPIKGLSVKGAVSYDPFNFLQKQWHKPFVFYTQNTSTTPYTYTSAFSTQETSAAVFTWLNQSYNQSNSLTFQGFLNYHNTFGKHDVTGLAVAERRSNKSMNFFGRRNNYAVDVDELSLGPSNKPDYDNGGSSSTSSQIGLVYRLNYAYDRRYLLEATGRYDGHYYFAPGKRWGFFPSFSAGWVISNEKFFESVRFVDNLKIRGSFGTSGLLAGGAFQYLNNYSLGGNAYAFGAEALVQGSSVPRENNPNITWEVAKKSDIAVEASLWKGLLRIEADYFYEKRSNMLINPAGAVPVEYGIALAQENSGKMDNQGFELTLGTTKRFANGLQLNVDANFSYAQNKVVELFENATTKNNPARRRTGRRWNTVFGYESMGLFKTSDDKNNDGVINATDGYTVAQFGVLRPGDIRYKDQNGDNKIDANDEVVIAYPQQPAMIYGLNISASWKGFDLTALLQGSGMSSFNTYGFMTVAHFNNNSNSAYEYYNNHWTPTTENAKYPRAYSNPNTNNGQGSDFWYKSTAYLRMRTASLGYTIPTAISSKAGIKNMRVYVTAQNLFTLSNIKFTDPETTGEQGYPMQKVFMFGFSASF